MKTDAGHIDSSAPLTDPSSLSEQLHVIDHTISSGLIAEGTEQLSALFLQGCTTAGEWRQLMEPVIKHRLTALLPSALEAALGLGSADQRFFDELASTFSDLGEVGAVEAAFRLFLASHPAEAGFLDAFGLFLLQQGKQEAAVDLYVACLDAHSESLQSSLQERLLLHLTQALLRSGKNESALEVLLQLSLLCPGHKETDGLFATALRNLRDFEQAISYYRRSLPHHACPVDVLLDIGDCFNQLNRPDLAADDYVSALKQDHTPLETELLTLNLAQMYFRIGEHDRSIHLYKQILADNPGHVLAAYFLLISLSVVGRPQIAEIKPTALALWRSYRASEEASALPSQAPQTIHSLTRAISPPSRIRIGILSSEIGEHVVGFFLTPFLERYDRSKLEVTILSVRDYEDPRSAYLKGLADSCVDLAGRDQLQARALVQAQNLDIILETSGYLHSAGLFILSSRCAPVQCHYIGFHATTQLDTIDYFIGDAETVPEAFADDYSEKLLRLPRPWLARSYSDGVPVARSIATYNGPVFGCFSSLHKINRQTLQFWGHALQAVPSGLLIIKDRLSAVPAIQQRILDGLGEFGVDAARISFLGQTPDWREHMNHFNLIDIAFDTTPWSGATTAFDTLSMGVPLIGIRGDCTSARMSSSVLKGIGCEQWIAESPEQFGCIARTLAADFQTLRAEKEMLQHRVLTSPLYDAAGLARSLECAFEHMLQRH